MFAGTLFGSVLGIMGSFAFVMALSEEGVTVLKNRANRKIYAQGILNRRINIGICTCEDQFSNKTDLENITTNVGN